jgi:hypothetical protein
MKNLFIILSVLLFSAQVFAVQTVVCTPAQKPDVLVTVIFYKEINPAKPFIGSYNWGATLKISRPGKAEYINQAVRMTPEVFYSDINLRGDAEGVYLRLYPRFDGDNNFMNYDGQLFINDLDAKVYYNFIDRDGVPALTCR